MLSRREMIVFAKRTSFVANYREFFLPGVERCVTGCALKEQLVASEREAGEGLYSDGSRGRIVLPPNGLRDGAGIRGAVSVYATPRTES